MLSLIHREREREREKDRERERERKTSFLKITLNIKISR